MRDKRSATSTYPPTIAVAVFVCVGLAACLGGDGGTDAPLVAVDTTEASPPVSIVYPTPSTIPVVASAIGGFSGILGASPTTVTTSTTGIQNGDAVQIAGSTNADYNVLVNVSNVTATGFDIGIVFSGPGGSGASVTQIVAGGVVSPGAIASCPTSGATGFITASVAASRYSGVAPLAVFFDASGTTATTTTLPFHNLEYQWNFGDPGSGNWTYGSRAGSSPRNLATGPVASHVFETPGTYTVTLTVTDGTNSVVNKCIQIAVLDANVIFAGNKTVCLSKDVAPPFAPGDACPTGAIEVQVPSGDFVAAMNTYIASGKRILLRRGESAWSAATGAGIAVNGPGILGAFGVGVKPKIQATNASGNTIIKVSAGTTPNISDWRIMDLELDGQGRNSSVGVQGNGGMNQLTISNLYAHNMQYALNFSASVLSFYNATPATSGHILWDQLTVANSTFDTAVNGGNIGFISAVRHSFLGNSADDARLGQHILRFQQIAKGVVSNNTLSRPLPSKHVIKMHGPAYGGGGAYTEQVVISDNKLTGDNNDWTASLEPQNAASDERLRNIIVERNWFVAGVGTRRALIMSGENFTIRNNIADMSGGIGNTCNEVGQRGVEPAPKDFRFYNNTCYNSESTAPNISFVSIGANVTNVAVVNNLASVPTGTGVIFIGTGASGFSQSTNLFGTPAALFVSGTPTLATDFALGAGSTARDAGTAIPVLSDFVADLTTHVRPQGGGFDIGAYEN